MSSRKLYQIRYKKSLDFNKMDNKILTKELISILRQKYPVKPAENISNDLGITERRVRNWMFTGSGMTALDLFRLIRTYDFISEWIMGVEIEGTTPPQ